MHIEAAQPSGLDTIEAIVQQTIQAVYPRYYPAGAVAFFAAHHSTEHIFRDIEAGCVFLGYDDAGRAMGTVTIRGNELCRLFVLPDAQGMGYGTALLDFAEERILSNYDYILLDASLPAKRIYLKRHYREVEYHILETPNGDKLCYDVMQKDRASQ